jgi:hypothetical protein
MRIASTINATSLSHAGEVYEPDDHGLFDVPEHVGQEMVRFAHWITEADAVDRHLAKRRADAVDPAVTDERLQSLEAAQAEKDAEIEKLRAALEEATKPKAPAKKAASKPAGGSQS